MATPKQIRRRGRWSLIVGLLLAVGALAAVAYADLQQIDGDLSTTGLDNVVNLNATAGSTVNTSAQVVIRYNNPQHLADGAVVPFQVSPVQTNLPAGYSVANVSVTIPSGWSDTSGPNADGRVGATSNISFTAPSTAGDYTYTVKYQVDKSGSYPSCIDDNPSCLTDSPGGGPAFTINLHVTAPSCTYKASFLPPLDQSTPSTFVGNTFKKGRVLPVKSIVWCEIGGNVDHYVTNQSPATEQPPWISQTNANFVAKATDAVETFSDAGSSSLGTQDFRWQADSAQLGGGYWLYNFDSSKLQVGQSISLYVNLPPNPGGTQISSTFVNLQPLK